MRGTGSRGTESGERRMQSGARNMMLAGARADYVGKVILKYGLLTQGGVR